MNLFVEMSKMLVKWYACVSTCLSGFENLMYADLYDGEENIAMKMIKAGFAEKCSPPRELVRFNDSIDSNATSVPSSTTTDRYVLIPG